jgi:RimJ/RimL family protein N-acetyltransferase
MDGPVFLEGERVALRPIEEVDLEFHQQAVNDPRIWRPTGRPRPVTREQEREFIEETVPGDDSVWLLVTDDSTRVGVVALREIEWTDRCGTLGYWIHPDHQRQGYGSEAVALLVDYGFQHLGLHRVEARTFAHNEASRALAESVGFTEEGVERERAFVDGDYCDVVRYGLLTHEWDGPPSAD